MPIPKRTLLATLAKPELIALARLAAIDFDARMSKDDLLDRVAGSDRADLAKLLPTLAYESLKFACKDLDLPTDGRETAIFVARLLAAVTPTGQPVRVAAPRAPDDFTLELSVEPRKPRLFWAIDWDDGHRTAADEKPIFESEWQSFRLRKSKGEVEALTFTAEYQYSEPGQHRIAARVTDVFGNDGIATVSCNVG